MIFQKQDLIDDVHETIKEEIVDQGRWHTYYERIFKHEGKYYLTTYRRGSTESQYSPAYEDEPDEIECEEVWPVEVKTIKYMTLKELNKHNDKAGNI